MSEKPDVRMPNYWKPEMPRTNPKKAAVKRAIQLRKNLSNKAYVNSLRQKRINATQRKRNLIRAGKEAARSAAEEAARREAEEAARSAAEEGANASVNNFRLPPSRQNAVSFVPASGSVSIHSRPRGGHTRRKQRTHRK